VYKYQPVSLALLSFRLVSITLITWFVPPVVAQAQSASLPATKAPKANFFRQLRDVYAADWHPSTAPAPAPARRGAPSPLDSPPFPSADWSYGGSPVIGEPDTNSYPLMLAWKSSRTSSGKSARIGDAALALSRSKIYGWLEPTVDASSSGFRNDPVSDDAYPNRAELGQSVLFLERLPDTVQQNHFDWGYHLTALFGTDYRYTIDKGYGYSQWFVHHRQYGFDPTMEYLDLYFPHVAQGMNLRIGRFISLPGIEAQLAPGNYMYSHSLLYSVDPFSDTGAVATVKLNDRWLVQAGLTAGHDVAPWTSDARPSATACVSYTSASVNDNLYACLNGINDGKYAYNNVQQYDVTWYHRFSRRWHIASEAWYMYETQVPDVGGSLPIETGTNGAFCAFGQLRCTAPEYAVVNYLEHEISPHDILSFRSDMLDDQKGQRTGFATRYTENTFSWQHWFGSTVQLRPEIRLDHSWNLRAYDLGRHGTQFTAASDLVFHF
jgi:hypothetical protein